MNAGFLNPTLSAEAFFAVPFEGDSRRTRFNLADYPDIAAWLLSFLDFIEHKQAQLPGERPIAMPPGGDTGRRLLEGHIVLATQRPDGGLALQLNSGIDVRLVVYARRRGQCATNLMLGLAEDPALTRWLLTHYRNRCPVPDLSQCDDALRASLERHGVLVQELPPDAAFFPDPDLEPDTTAELACAARVIPQAVGEPMPAEIRVALGRHTPALPPARALLWGRDAGTGMVYPTLWHEPGSSADAGRSAGSAAARRLASWQQQRQVARQSLRTRRYAELREIVPPAQQARLRQHARLLVERGYFPALDDGQVKRRAGLHNPPTLAALHQGLADLVNDIADEPVIASYCYLGCYEEGAVLERHRDRPQCVYNLSLVLDMQGPRGEPEPWPIYLELDGRPVAVRLQVGDGLVYSGTEIWHWREALPAGQRAIVCFYHFVPHGFTGSLD